MKSSDGRRDDATFNRNLIPDFPTLREQDICRLYKLLGRDAQARVTAVLVQELWAASDSSRSAEPNSTCQFR
jgi:hypothetical protein